MIVAAAICAASLTAGILTCKRTINLFQEPPPAYGEGFVAVGFAGTSKLPVRMQEVILVANGHDSVTYTLRFPSGAKGKAWAILLTGTAVLSEPHASGSTLGTGWPRITYPECPGIPNGCELIEGQVSDDPHDDSDLMGYDQPCASVLTSSAFIDSVVVSGIAHMTLTHSGGRKSVRLLQDPPFADQLNGVLGPTFHGVDDVYRESEDITTCKEVQYFPDVEVGSAAPAPQFNGNGELAWITTTKATDATSYDNQVLTLRPTDLASRQNLGIILIGIEFALLSGFLPVLVESCIHGALARRRRGVSR